MSNSISILGALSTLDELQAASETWETGSYKKSNDELYAIIDRCYVLHEQISGMMTGKRKLIKKINERLKVMDINPDKIGDLATKIVRCTFKDTGKRSNSYARAIRFAMVDKPKDMSMAAYITKMGGIEELRRTPKPGALTPSEVKAKLVEEADEKLSSVQPLIGKIKLVDELQPANDSEFDFCAALVRKNPDGTGSIVYGSTTTSILKTLLVEAAKKQAEAEKVVEDNSKGAREARERVATVKKLAADKRKVA